MSSSDDHELFNYGTAINYIYRSEEKILHLTALNQARQNILLTNPDLSEEDRTSLEEQTKTATDRVTRLQQLVAEGVTKINERRDREARRLARRKLELSYTDAVRVCDKLLTEATSPHMRAVLMKRRDVITEFMIHTLSVSDDNE
jgi:phosphatidylserine/phosphatidylglycerophosphate/cardiolipin synthase-like enzyme